jgi:hypothetical protein
MFNQIESTADLGRVLFIDFMTSPQAGSSARDDKAIELPILVRCSISKDRDFIEWIWITVKEYLTIAIHLRDDVGNY